MLPATKKHSEKISIQQQKQKTLMENKIDTKLKAKFIFIFAISYLLVFLMSYSMVQAQEKTLIVDEKMAEYEGVGYYIRKVTITPSDYIIKVAFHDVRHPKKVALPGGYELEEGPTGRIGDIYLCPIKEGKFFLHPAEPIPVEISGYTLQKDVRSKRGGDFLTFTIKVSHKCKGIGFEGLGRYDKSYIFDLTKFDAYIPKRLSVQKVMISDKEIKAYYDSHPDLFKQPEQIRASHILIKVDPQADKSQKAKARKKLEKIQQKLQKGEDFATLAREFSQCPSSANGGDLGYFSRGKMVKPFEEVAFALRPGEVSDIVETVFGYHLIKLIDKIPETTIAYKDIKDRLGQYLKQEKVQIAPEIKVEKTPPTLSITTPEPLIVKIDKAPSRNLKCKNGYAVVVGVEKYRDLPQVEFAQRDAQVMKEYLINTMGFPEENIVILLNERALRSDLGKYFETWLKNNVDRNSTVFIYYSGHGAPGPKDNRAYLVPYDGDPNYPETTCYPIDSLYASLNKLLAKQIIVAIDSCFSGAGGRSVIAKGARPLVHIPLENPILASSNTVVLTAAAENQIASFYPEAKHGLFTYFFLRGLRGDGDLDGDGWVELKELFDYLKPEVKGIARRMNREQVPVILPSPELLGKRGKYRLTKAK